MTKKVSSRCTTFGCSGTRFAPEQSKRPEGVLGPAEMPGPQSYNPIPTPKQWGQAATNPTSNFSSRTKRMAGSKPPTEPKPSEFEADDAVLGALSGAWKFAFIVRMWVSALASAAEWVQTCADSTGCR